MNYHYPIEYDWAKEEIIDVVNFYSCVEKAYEGTVNAEDVLLTYSKFKKVVPSKSEEKQYFLQFEQNSGYTPYKVVKEAKDKKIGKMKL